MEFRTVNGIVGRNVEVVYISRHRVVFRDIGKTVFFGRSHFNGLAECLGFFQGLLGPCTGIEIRCFLFEEVIGNHAEFQTGTATEEEYGISVGNVQDFFKKGNRLIHHRLEILGPMADFH